MAIRSLVCLFVFACLASSIVNAHSHRLCGKRLHTALATTCDKDIDCDSITRGHRIKEVSECCTRGCSHRDLKIMCCKRSWTPKSSDEFTSFEDLTLDGLHDPEEPQGRKVYHSPKDIYNLAHRF